VLQRTGGKDVPLSGCTKLCIQCLACSDERRGEKDASLTNDACGKDRKVADIPVDHPSCSRQHAAFQYRAVEKQLGSRTVNRVVPYIIDLESSNGTFVNNQKIEPKRYVELKEQDVLKFGYSSREYVLLHENSQNDEDDE